MKAWKIFEWVWRIFSGLLLFSILAACPAMCTYEFVSECGWSNFLAGLGAIILFCVILGCAMEYWDV